MYQGVKSEFQQLKRQTLDIQPLSLYIIEGSVEETLKAKGQTSMFLKQRGNEAYVPIHCLVGKPAILFSAVSCVASHDTDSDKHTNSLSFMFHLSSVC